MEYTHTSCDLAPGLDDDILLTSVYGPVLQVERVVYLENGRAIEYSRSRNRFDTRGYSLLDVKNI